MRLSLLLLITLLGATTAPLLSAEATKSPPLERVAYHPIRWDIDYDTDYASLSREAIGCGEVVCE